MIKMVNLNCIRCGMSLDVEVSNLQRYCPNCGHSMLMTVEQVIDILDDKKEIKQKSIKYVKDVKVSETKKKQRKPRAWIWIIAVLLVAAASLYIWRSCF